MAQASKIYSDPLAGFNSVIRSKVYGLWGVHKDASGQAQSVKIDEIPAPDVSTALREGRKKWGKTRNGDEVILSAILIPGTTTAKRSEPMFER